MSHAFKVMNQALRKAKIGLSCFLLTAPVVLAGCSGPLSALDPAGPSARGAAWLWWCMFAFFTLVLLVVVILWIYALRRSSVSVSEHEAKHIHRRWIIGGGILLPSVTIIVLLLFGIPIGHRMLPLPPEQGNAVRIDVTGHQFWWEIRYPDTGINLVNELHIPVDVPVDIHLTTADVIHAFWVPRLAGKLDAIPGRTNILRIEADKPGVYRGQCAEFCGLHHAHMQFTVTAYEQEEFEQWFNLAREKVVTQESDDVQTRQPKDTAESNDAKTLESMTDERRTQKAEHTEQTEQKNTSTEKTSTNETVTTREQGAPGND